MFGRLLRLHVIKILDLLTFSFFAFLSSDNIRLVDILYYIPFVSGSTGRRSRCGNERNQDKS